MAAAVSPASSPRLPSPPPIAEDQIGPTSPGVSLFEDHGKLSGINETGASRRIRPGTKAADMAEGPPLVELQEVGMHAIDHYLSNIDTSDQLDSAFQLTEHLKALHYARTHNDALNSIRPISVELARELSQPPTNTSREIWLYELGRFLIQKTNAIIVALFADSPPCSPQTCPEMRASEWQYLCAVHDPPKSCSAIDYCCHTLDWAATSLTSSKMFPSRLGLGTGNVGGGSDKFMQQQMKEITNIFRRVYRIYAHAWFQHREMFWKVEGKTGLYVFFKTVCDEYGLIQPENYTIPPEAEGEEPRDTPTTMEQDRSRPLSILPRPGESAQDKAFNMEPLGNSVESLGNTTKRHTRGNSSLSGSVHTVIQEEAEEEEENPAKPGIERSNTVLVSSDNAPIKEELSLPMGAEESREEETILPTVSRSDTLKPEKQSDPDFEPNATVKAEPTDDEAGETTMITVDGSEVETKPDEPGVQVKVEAIDSLEPADIANADAAAPEEASKSVGD